MNALRRGYFGDFGLEDCDRITAPNPQIPGVLVFERGCSAQQRVAVIASFDTENNKTLRVPVSWAAGTELADCVAEKDPLMFMVSPGRDVTVMLQPLEVIVLVPMPVVAVPPSVIFMSPSHGSHVTWHNEPGIYKNITLRFDRAMDPEVVNAARLNGQPAYFRCAQSCSEIFLEVEMSSMRNGFHTVEVQQEAHSLDGSEMFVGFRGSFIVDRDNGAIAKPQNHQQNGLICGNFTQLCHNASGADWLRIKNLGSTWSSWKPMEAVSEWESIPGVSVLVQYHAEGSAAFVVGDCRDLDSECVTTYHESMNIFGEFNQWGKDENLGSMMKLKHFTWAVNLTLDRFVKAKFAPFRDWSISYGIHPARELLYNMPSFDERYYTFNVEPTMSGTEASRKWMMERKRWTEQENLASGAEFAIELWLSHLCSPKAPECEPPREAVDWEGHGFLPGEDQEWCRTVGVYKCMEYKENDNSPAMSNCGQFSCCRRKVSSVPSGASETCCVLFNDLLLNYTVTSDLSQCSGLATTMTTTLPLKTCPPKPVTLEEARTLGRAQISPYEPDGPQIQETLQWSRDRVIEAEKDFQLQKYKRFFGAECWCMYSFKCLVFPLFLRTYVCFSGVQSLSWFISSQLLSIVRKYPLSFCLGQFH